MKPTDPSNPQQKSHPSLAQTFSPTNTQQFSNFFNPKGPIRPQSLVAAPQTQNQKVRLPPARDFIRPGPQDQPQEPTFMANQPASHYHQFKQHSSGQYPTEDDYYDEEDDGEEEEKGGPSRPARSNISPEQEQQILARLRQQAQKNPEFMKVVSILQNDPELKPLIFEHDVLLNALTEMKDMKAEYMLSILTAAETEMYESSKLREDLQSQFQAQQEMIEVMQKNQLQSQQSSQKKPPTESKEVSVNIELPSDPEKDQLLSKTQTASFEIERLKQDLSRLEKEKMSLSLELTKEKELREALEREKECTFKNLYDENQQLKKANDTLRKNETEVKRAVEAKEARERELSEEVESLRAKLRSQEELRVSMLQNKSRLEVDLNRNQQFIENLEKEINLLEKENEHLHRKLHSTYNSVLFQSKVNNAYLTGLREDQSQNIDAGEGTPARRNLSNSFQYSGLLDNNLKKDQTLVGQPVFGHSTQKLKMLMSENNRSNSNGQSFIAHSIYYGLGGAAPNHYFQRGDSLVRSNSIEVILLDEEESKKQNYYPLGEDEKRSQTSGVMTNKQSWIKTKGLFTDLSPINSISSQQMDPSTSRQNQQRMRRLHDVEEEQAEILGTNATNPYPAAKYYEEQVRKLQQEIEKLKEENQELTQKLTSQQFHFGNEESSAKKEGTFATPQNTGHLLQAVRMDPSEDKAEFNYQRQIQLTNNINPMVYSNEQSPMMMATFSKEKEKQQFYSQRIGQYQPSQQSSLPKHQHSESERERFLEQQFEKLSSEFSNRLQEIGTRLLNLFKKLQPQASDLANYQQSEFTVTLIKDLIYDLAVKLDSHIELSQHSRVRSGGLFSQGGTQQQLYYPQSFSGMGNISTTIDVAEMKNLLLEEKERRLHAMEELQKTKEHVMKFQTENEKLKQELYFEKNNSPEYQTNETTLRNLQLMQARYDSLQDENVSLKLRVSELESELMDERQKQVIKYDFSIENLKNNMNTQYFEYKMRFEEQIMNLKSQNSKLTTDVQGLLERNGILKEQNVVYRERIQELEKENLLHSKENYILQNELDYESLRASQLQSKKETQKNFTQTQIMQEKTRLEEVIAKQELRIKDLQFQSSDWEIKARKVEDLSTLQQMRSEDEIFRLKGDNQKLMDELKKMQTLNKKSADSLVVEKTQQMQITNQLEKKRAAQKLVSLLKRRQSVLSVKCYMRLWANSLVHRQRDLKLNDSLKSFNAGTGNEEASKIQMLEEQIYKLSTMNQQLATQIGKILRYVNTKQPIKLSLQGLVTKMSLDYVLSGLKRNTEVYELNLSKCELDDEDMLKIANYLEQDSGLRSVKLGKNSFTSILPLLNLLALKGSQLRHLDLQQLPLDQNTLKLLPQTLSQMPMLEELNLSGMIDQPLGTQTDLVNLLLLKITSMNSLRGLDLSKNKLTQESFILLFSNLKNLLSLEALALSQLQITDESGFVFHLANWKKIKRLNISGNQDLSSNALGQMINTMKQTCVIEDLDLSRCKVSGCMPQFASLVSLNKNLRSITIQRAGLTDQIIGQLAQPIAESLNIETLRLDFNNFTGNFIEALCSRMLGNKLSKQKRSANNSFLGQEDEYLNSSVNEDQSQSSTTNLRQKKQREPNIGLLQLSLEGNQIGDKGAVALARLIMTPNENTKQLKQVNLNECGISNDGFEALRSALTERGNLTQIASLSHVKITIERNNFTY